MYKSFCLFLFALFSKFSPHSKNESTGGVIVLMKVFITWCLGITSDTNKYSAYNKLANTLRCNNNADA